MKSIKQVASSDAILMSPYKGSEKTYEMVKNEIALRWGDKCARSYNPYSDMMPFSSWLAQGFKVRKGEKAIKSVTFVEVKDANNNVVKKIKRTVSLFHKCQVDKIV